MCLAATATERDNDRAGAGGREIDWRIHPQAQIAPRLIAFLCVKLDSLNAYPLVQRETEMAGQRFRHGKIIDVSAAIERYIPHTRRSVSQLMSDREKQGKHNAGVPSPRQMRKHGDRWVKQKALQAPYPDRQEGTQSLGIRYAGQSRELIETIAARRDPQVTAGRDNPNLSDRCGETAKLLSERSFDKPR